MTSWVPDYSLEAPDGHTWMRPSPDCRDCRCCSAALCDQARQFLLGCDTLSSGGSDFDLTACPCIGRHSEAIQAARVAVQAEPDDDTAIEAGARALHTEMTRPMSSPPDYELSPYAAGYRRLVGKNLPILRSAGQRESTDNTETHLEQP